MNLFVRSLFLLTTLLIAAGCATAPKPAARWREVAVPSLERALSDYRRIEANGGWPSVPDGPKLLPGDTSERVDAVRKRLVVTGDLARSKSTGDFYDEDLVRAVTRFQERHGLEPDGTIGKETVLAFNVPVYDRIRQIELNIRRREELKRLGDRYLAVNIPDFRLKVVDGGKVVLGMKVVVGQRREWQTPLLSSQITYLILNPKWNVPDGIFAKELIHDLRKDATYLTRHGMKVLQASTGTVVDPATIDWNQVSAKGSGYRIVQREGAGNSLGRIKFMFPNPYAVYLHDTPQKKLFGRAMRALSHGCVRVEQPMDLATYLMKDDPEWARERIESAIASGRNRDVPLPSPMPLHIIYLTSWVDDQGVLNFRNDIYGNDAADAARLGSY